jgi:formiminotetrahydrofolate cyclodeaminase
MKSLTEMIEKLTRQRVAASTVNQCMKNQLKRLKKITSKLEKEFMKKREHVDS